MNNIFLSFLAGLILNFMPCILPILLIKIYDVIKYSQTDKNKSNLKIISISTTLGIVSVFLLFSLINILFKHAGKTFNFGFHFQNPYFVILVIFLLFLFLLNLLNFFHINYSPKLISYIQKKYEKSKNLNRGIFLENFTTAIFMVLFATPCSIPILGTVATFSLTTSNIYIIYNFLAMGFGMSIPFLLILVYPNLLNFLKNKSGLLNFIHKIIILSIFLTILWLLYVLKVSIGIKSTIILILFMLLLVIQFKLIKKSLHNIIMVIIIIVSGMILPITIFKDEEAFKINNSLWLNSITKEEIENYINEEKTIFVNITAKWCMVCNLNNVTVFSKYNVLDFLKNDNIIAIKIDVTQNNDTAEIFYDNPNSIYVPKYIIFNKKHPKGCNFKGQIIEKDFFKEINKCL